MKILVRIIQLCLFVLLVSAPVQAAEPIKIGDISSYTSLAYFAEPYKNGWQMALEEINDSGGVLGRPLEVISRDSRGNPGDAVNIAQDLIHTEDVFALMGPILSHVGLAVSEIAEREKVPLVTSIVGTDKLLWEKHHPYVFRVYSGVHQMTAMLLEGIKDLDAQHWAIVVENYEAGHAHADEFIRQIKLLNPNVQFVDKQYPALHKINAGAVVQSVRRSKPDALFVFLLGKNMSAFLREMRLRGLDNIPAISPNLGLPEEQSRFGDEIAEGWHTIGPPDEETAGAAYKAFYQNYRAKYQEEPGALSIVGYLALKSIAKAIEHAGVIEREAFLKAMNTDLFPFFYDKPFTFRKVDNQSNFAWATGVTALRDGAPYLSNKQNLIVEEFFAPEDYVLKKQKGE